MAQNETSGTGIGDLRSIFGKVPRGGDGCLIIRQWMVGAIFKNRENQDFKTHDICLLVR